MVDKRKFAQILLARRARQLLSVSETERVMVGTMISFRAEVLKEMDSLKDVSASLQKLRLNRILQDIDNRLVTLTDDLGTTLTQGVGVAFKKGLTDVTTVISSAGLKPSFTQTPDRALRAAIKFGPLRRATDKLGSRSAKTIREVTIKGIAQGQPIDTMKRELSKKLGIENWRAAAIARTNVIAASNEGHLESYRQNEQHVKGKIWDTTFDDRTSLVCAEMHGQRVLIDEQFYSEVLDEFFDASPAHVNCRSQTVPWFRSETLNKIVDSESKRVREFAITADGKVQEKQTKAIVNQSRPYEGWLKEQPRAVQANVLGSKLKAQAFDKGLIGMVDVFTDKTGLLSDANVLKILEKAS